MPKSKTDISIIIVNYNVRECISDLLESLSSSSCKKCSYEVIVVDNASSDESVKWLRDNYPEIKLIVNKENIGFGRANNQAAKIANGEVLLFLNPDTILQPDTIEILHQYLDMQQDSMVGCGCQIRNPDGELAPESKRHFPSVRNIMSKSISNESLGGWPVNSSYYDRDSLEQNTNVEVLSGCCFMIRKNIFEEMGGFDDQFFLFGEDVDLCYRIYEAGYELGYTADTYIIHRKGQSTKQNELRYLWHFYKSAYLYAVKHHQRSHSPSFKLMILSGAVIHATAKYIYRKLDQSKQLALRLFI